MFLLKNIKFFKYELTAHKCCDIVDRQDVKRSFFYALFQAHKVCSLTKFRTHAEVELCVQRLHWLVPNASSAITILQRRKKIIPTEWRTRNTVGSAGPIHYTRKQSNSLRLGGILLEKHQKKMLKRQASSNP